MDLFDDEMFEDEAPEPNRGRSRARRRRAGGAGRMRGETAKRILVAIPWIAFAIAITVAGGLVFAVAMIGDRRALPARVLRDDRGSCGRSQSPPTSRSPALVVAAYFGTAFNVPAGPRRLLPAALRLRRRPHAPRRDRRLDGGDAARASSGSGSRWSTPCCSATCPTTARRCWSTSSSAPSSPTPPPTRPAACSAATRSPRASRRTRPSRGCRRLRDRHDGLLVRRPLPGLALRERTR